MWSPSYYQSTLFAGDQRFFRAAGENFLTPLPLMIIESGHSRWADKQSFARRKSEIFCIEFVTAGNAAFTQNGRKSIVKPGQAFLLQKGGSHDFRPGPAGFLHKRMVTIDGMALPMVLQSAGLLNRDVVSCTSPVAFANLIKRVNRTIGTPSNDAAWELSRLAYEILLDLGRNCTEAVYSPEVTKAIRFMNRSLSRNLTLGEVAKHCNLSMFHFSRLFQNALKCPPMEFYTRERIALAKNLVRNSSMRIKEISQILGYSDPFYFSAQFRRWTGFSPRSFRQGKSGAAG